MSDFEIESNIFVAELESNVEKVCLLPGELWKLRRLILLCDSDALSGLG